MSTKVEILDLQQYERLERISKNSNYDLYKVRQIETEKIYIAKISNTSIEDESSNPFLKEINNGIQYDIPSVIKYIGYSPVNFENKKRPVIILEYCSNGTLEKIIDLENNSKTVKGWNDTKRLITLYGISYAMSILHSQNIVFKDLSPSNVFMDDSLFPKIHGFSHISPITDEEDSDRESNSDIAPAYMAPEIMNEEPYQLKSDVYSFGILAYEIVSGKRAFSKTASIMKILTGDRPKFSESVPKCYQELISRCWSENIDERPTFPEIMEYLKTDKDFITENVDQGEFNDYQAIFDSVTPTIPDDEKLLHQGLDFLQTDKKEAFERFKESAEKGNLEAMNYCGIMLLNDEDIPSNEEEAKRYFKEAAESGNAEAMNNYGFYLLQTKNTGEDKASDYLKKSADEGCVDAMINYGNLLYCGDDTQNVPTNKEEALKYFKMAADKNSTDGLYYYALMLKNGEGVDKPDLKQALQLFKQVSDDEEKPEAMLEYALLLINEDADIGAPHDKEKALEYLKNAADKGNIDAMYNYASILFNDAKEKEIKEEAIKYYKNSAEKGHLNGMNEYALISDNKDIDDKLIAKYFKMAANFGCIDAMYNYGWALFNGVGVAANSEKALRYFKKAADFGHVDAMYKYATMMEYGEGADIDKNEAMKYYKQAADEGSIDAMNSYALMISKDDEVTQNDEEASEYFKKAADLGHANAMNNYGEMLMNGKGVPKDENKALQYFKMAADLEDPDGIANYQKAT